MNPTHSLLWTQLISGGKGVILITVGYEAFISGAGERRDGEEENKVLAGNCSRLEPMFEKLLKITLLNGRSVTCGRFRSKANRKCEYHSTDGSYMSHRMDVGIK